MSLRSRKIRLSPLIRRSANINLTAQAICAVRICSLLVYLASAGVAHSEELDFDRDIRPILISHCAECHGAEAQSSSLRVDSRGELLDGGDSGPAVVPGDSEASYLVQLITSDDPDVRMPPADTQDRLKNEEIAKIRQWIAEGAKGAEAEIDPRSAHWSFQPVVRPDVPRGLNKSPEFSNPIDAFLVERLGAAGLEMSPPTDARSFIRRVTLDLIGLPPSPEDVAAFVSECAKADGVNDDEASKHRLPDKAVSALIDRLLASPHYGERWAQHWLDVIRYADTSGYEKNKIRPTAWPYRDYVIQALNNDIPWPRFILEQLAGDTVGMDPATGFLVTHPFPEPIEVGQEPKLIAQVRFNGLDEVVQNVSSAMLGLTVGCARCHDHKFDPISTKDYYRLAATFSGVEFAERRWKNGMQPSDRIVPVTKRIVELRQALSAHSHYQEREPNRVTEVFEPLPAKRVRMTIIQSSDKKYAPAIDEFQVWTKSDNDAPARNVALASNGGRVRTSGADASLDSHDKLLNDDIHGESSLWVAANKSHESVVTIEVELLEPCIIDRIAWCQERELLSKDFIRLYKRRPTQYRIEVADANGQWQSVSEVSRTVGPDDNLQPSIDKFERDLEAQFRRLRDLQHVFAGEFRAPAAMYVLRRGDPQQPLAAIGPGGISVLGNYELANDFSDTKRRTALAEWMGSERHPLTARVIVNRVWQQHFGTGIVETPSDFGTQGGRPSHPQLLDWLASEFMTTGWRLKDLHRLICNSNAYRQSSHPIAKALLIDADSRLLWRFPPRRLEAEAIRDSMIFVAGLLDTKAGGPGVNLYQSKRFGSQYVPDERLSMEQFPRSVFLLKVRGADDGLFKAFDVPDCGQVRPKRTVSTTPLQALNLFNSPFTQVIASRLANHVVKQAGDGERAQIDHLYSLLLCREPTLAERDSCAAVGRDHGLETVCRALLNSNEFLYIP